MKDSDTANQARLRLQVINANILEARHKLAPKTFKLGILEEPGRSDTRLLAYLLKSVFDCDAKSFSGFVCQLVDVISDLKDDVPTGCGAKDYSCRLLTLCEQLSPLGFQV